ncbi:MAG: SLBB domain-containing protein [Terracidiphilus sp.]
MARPNWDYAVIERLDRSTMTTSLIPFDLGKLVLEHDASQDLALEPGDAVTIFSRKDLELPVDRRTKYVRLEGEIVKAGVYSVNPGETLQSLVERAGGLTPKAYLYGRRVHAQEYSGTRAATVGRVCRSSRTSR